MASFGHRDSIRWTESPTRLDLETTELDLSADGQLATEQGRYRMGDEPTLTGMHITIWAQTVEGWKIPRSVWESS